LQLFTMAWFTASKTHCGLNRVVDALSK